MEIKGLSGFEIIDCNVISYKRCGNSTSAFPVSNRQGSRSFKIAQRGIQENKSASLEGLSIGPDWPILGRESGRDLYFSYWMRILNMKSAVSCEDMRTFESAKFPLMLRRSDQELMSTIRKYQNERHQEPADIFLFYLIDLSSSSRRNSSTSGTRSSARGGRSHPNCHKFLVSRLATTPLLPKFVFHTLPSLSRNSARSRRNSRCFV
jgi:hypothetical protein